MTIASEKEIWRGIDGFDGFYEVSNLGRIRSKDHFVRHSKGGLALKKSRIIKTAISKKTGYECFSISYKGKRNTFLVHRCVVVAFPEICGESFLGFEVDHINTVRNDNRAENLRVCTRHENHLNPITRKRYSEMNKGKKKTTPVWNKGLKLPFLSGENSSRSIPIIQFDTDGNFIKKWENTSFAANSLGVARTAITNCLTGRSKKAKGYLWKYESEVCFVN